MRIIARHFPTVPSTNGWALQNYETLPLDMITVVWTDEQMEGKGRRGKRWTSNAGENLTATFCFFLEGARKDFGNLAQLMALAAAETMENLGLLPEIKWPNDLLVNDRKIGGILCETTPYKDRRFTALGIGLNVNMGQETLEKIDQPATSLAAELGRALDPAEIREAIGVKFAAALEIFISKGFPPFYDAVKNRMAAGKKISISENGKIFRGTLLGLNPDGSIKVLLDTGETLSFHSGEIIRKAP